MYFNKFPKIAYKFPNNKTVIVTDIFRSVKFTKETLEKPELFEEFMLTDGDRPESVARKYYGDPKYFWLVLLSNDVIDINTEWPRFSLHNKTNEQNLYSGFAIHFTNEMDILAGDYVVKRNTGLSGDVGEEYGIVDRYIPSMNKIEIRNNNFSTVTTGSEFQGDDLGEFFIFRKEGNNFTTISTGVSGDVDYLTAHRIDLLKDSLAFFKFDKRVLNPLTAPAASMDPTNQNYSTTGDKKDKKSILRDYIRGLDRGTSFTNKDITIVKYSEVQAEASESSSTKIKLLRKEFLFDIVVEVESLIRDMNSGDVKTIRKYVTNRNPGRQGY